MTRTPELESIHFGRSQDKKLKPTLNQGLEFINTSVNIPVKQTSFYDNKHGSTITESQMS